MPLFENFFVKNASGKNIFNTEVSASDTAFIDFCIMVTSTIDNLFNDIFIGRRAPTEPVRSVVRYTAPTPRHAAQAVHTGGLVIAGTGFDERTKQRTKQPKQQRTKQPNQQTNQQTIDVNTTFKTIDPIEPTARPHPSPSQDKRGRRLSMKWSGTDPLISHPVLPVVPTHVPTSNSVSSHIRSTAGALSHTTIQSGADRRGSAPAILVESTAASSSKLENVSLS